MLEALLCPCRRDEGRQKAASSVQSLAHKKRVVTECDVLQLLGSTVVELAPAGEIIGPGGVDYWNAAQSLQKTQVFPAIFKNTAVRFNSICLTAPSDL